MVGFSFCRKNNFSESLASMAVNTRGRRMSEGIKMMIVRYLLLELSVEVIREKLKHLVL